MDQQSAPLPAEGSSVEKTADQPGPVIIQAVQRVDEAATESLASRVLAVLKSRRTIAAGTVVAVVAASVFVSERFQNTADTADKPPVVEPLAFGELEIQPPEVVADTSVAASEDGIPGSLQPLRTFENQTEPHTDGPRLFPVTTDTPRLSTNRRVWLTGRIEEVDLEPTGIRRISNVDLPPSETSGERR